MIILTNASANFDYQYQSAIHYYQQIDTWNFVNVTFDQSQSRIFLSLNNDDKRLIPLTDYPMLAQHGNASTKLNVKILVDQADWNVTCLLPYSGFNRNMNTYVNLCSTNIKTCGEFIGTSVRTEGAKPVSFRTSYLYLVEQCRTVLSTF